MSSPKVSILMACFNAEPYVGAALESIRRQTYDNIEVVIVDDGSSDRSAAIVGQHADLPITFLQQGNRGAAQARNLAFVRSAGDFVLFLDADDIIAPKHVECLVARLLENRDCVALSQWDRFQQNPSEATFPKRATERDLAGPDWLELDWRDAQPMTQSGMFLLPRKLLLQCGLWDETLSLSDDFEFFARTLSRCGGVRFAPEARLFYRSAVPNSLSARKSRTAVLSGYRSLDMGTRHLLAAKDTPQVRRICANLMQHFEYNFFPLHADLRRLARARVADLGGSDIEPDGPPGFQKLRRLTGWKAARVAQRVLAGA